jgi:hypothetical protein
MAQTPDNRVQLCYQRARDAKHQANEAADPASRVHCLKMDTHWLALARSHEFSERLTTFIGSDLKQRKRFYEGVRTDEGRDEPPRWQRVL